MKFHMRERIIRTNQFSRVKMNQKRGFTIRLSLAKEREKDKM